MYHEEEKMSRKKLIFCVKELTKKIRKNPYLLFGKCGKIVMLIYKETGKWEKKVKLQEVS